MGHEVSEAENGKVAIEKYHDAPSDAVLVDLYMPELDGVETMIRLKEDFPDVKVVAVSGGGWKDKQHGLQDMTALGALDTIAKPFTPDDVNEVVGRILDEPVL